MLQKTILVGKKLSGRHVTSQRGSWWNQGVTLQRNKETRKDGRCEKDMQQRPPTRLEQGMLLLIVSTLQATSQHLNKSMPGFLSGKDSLLVTQSTSQRTNQPMSWPEEPASLTTNHAVNHTVKYSEKQKKQPPCQSFPPTSKLGVCLPPCQQTNQPTTLPSQVSCQDVSQ